MNLQKNDDAYEERDKKMKKKIWKLLCCFLLMIAAALSCAVTVIAETPQKEIAFAMNMKPSDAVFAATHAPQTHFDDIPHIVSTHTFELSSEDLDGLMLCPGGMAFGVKFYTEGVTVVGSCEVNTETGKANPANEAGLRSKDIILSVNGEQLNCAADLTERIEGCQGKALQLHCRRANKEFDTVLQPVYCPEEARYKTGIWVRDSGAGIGTVTFIIPETGAFAGLGHGICDADTGALIPMKRGSVSNVTISNIVKGTAGKPGELKGYFNAVKVGALLGNSACGVWGMYSKPPQENAELLPVGSHTEIEEGNAYILCTLNSNKIEKYDIHISNINRDAKGSKCFTVTVTDPKLLSATGGIVQGMSGSPIIQNGKLVGAVTHVLINDPTTGYGIFIENMLNAANIPMAKAS